MQMVFKWRIILLFLTSYSPHSPVLYKGNKGYWIPIKLARNILFIYIRVNKTDLNMILDRKSCRYRYEYKDKNTNIDINILIFIIMEAFYRVLHYILSVSFQYA